MMRWAMVVMLMGSAAGCADLEDSDLEGVEFNPASARLLIPLMDGDDPVDCANTRDVATQLWATDGTSSVKLWYSGCVDGIVTVSRPSSRWTHLRLEVRADGASWDACPGAVELHAYEGTYAFDVRAECL